jgi:Fe-S-cluster containining protein
MTAPQNTQPPKTGRAKLEQQILDDYPRLGPDDKFKFACHPGVSCFNRCCADVNIFLSPYDVLRMKKRLGMKSSDFLEKYTLLPVQKDMKFPAVMLRMRDDEGKHCSFLTDKGCGIYPDRPWPCRMYPLGLAIQKDAPDGACGGRFYFLMRDERCQGFGEPRELTVRQWFDEQAIDECDRWGESFKELVLHKVFTEGEMLSPQKMHMFFTACYDLDKFREFVFNTTLLKRFDVDEDFVEEMRYSDEALLRFAFLWLRFSLCGEQTVKVKPEVAEAFQGSLNKRELFAKQAPKAPPEEQH